MIKEGLEYALDAVQRAWPSGYVLWYTIAAIVFAMANKRNRALKMTGFYAAFAFVVFFIPPVTIAINYFLRDGLSTWRYFWIIPGTILVSAAAVILVSGFSKKGIRAVTCLLLIALIAAGGRCIYSQSVFSKAYSREKLPLRTLQISDAINRNIADTGNATAFLASDNTVNAEIREVNSNVITYRARILDDTKYIKSDPDFYRNIHVLNGDWEDTTHLTAGSLKDAGMNYIQIYSVSGCDADLEKLGYTVILEGGTWNLWYNPEM